MFAGCVRRMPANLPGSSDTQSSQSQSSASVGTPPDPAWVGPNGVFRATQALVLASPSSPVSNAAAPPARRSDVAARAPAMGYNREGTQPLDLPVPPHRMAPAARAPMPSQVLDLPTPPHRSLRKTMAAHTQPLDLPVPPARFHGTAKRFKPAAATRDALRITPERPALAHDDASSADMLESTPPGVLVPVAAAQVVLDDDLSAAAHVVGVDAIGNAEAGVSPPVTQGIREPAPLPVVAEATPSSPPPPPPSPPPSPGAALWSLSQTDEKPKLSSSAPAAAAAATAATAVQAKAAPTRTRKPSGWTATAAQTKREMRQQRITSFLKSPSARSSSNDDFRPGGAVVDDFFDRAGRFV